MKGENVREIEFDLTGEESLTRYEFGGFSGEHEATKVTVRLPERMLFPWEVSYRFQLELGSGKAVTSAPLRESEGKVSLTLPQSLTVAPQIKMQVIACDKDATGIQRVLKSPKMILRIEEALREKDTPFESGADPVPGLEVDEGLDPHSQNPVENRAVWSAMQKKLGREELVTAEKGGILPLAMAGDAVPVSEAAVALALERVKADVAVTVDKEMIKNSQNPVESRVLCRELAPALRRTASDRVIRTGPLSPLWQSLEIYLEKSEGEGTVLVSGKNLVDVSRLVKDGFETYDGVNYEITFPEITLGVLKEICPPMAFGGTFTLSYEGERLGNCRLSNGRVWENGKSLKLTPEDGDLTLILAIEKDQNWGVLRNLMLECGYGKSEYEPYAAPLAYTVGEEAEGISLWASGGDMTLWGEKGERVTLSFNRDPSAILDGVEAALDGILAIQDTLLGGDGV